ncbi:MAG: tryptophanyl-tRNA synthetase [Chloroflexota bacterium]|jgi:tryptophanyl-tRNA synthetase|nr:tryptophanyl-tRNA synthetase [Chloroflexota bacterium]
MSPARQRVLSGMQPTGRMHIGHYFGALRNYVRMQDEYEAFYCVVDLHALTTFEQPAELWPNVTAMVADWIAAGLDPERATIFVQSQVPEVTELHWILSAVTPISWLERVPTFKEKSEQHPDNVNYALLGYPVLQAADILIYGASRVPVGEDQLAHLELTREIARRFNHKYGATFTEPKAELTETPRVMGLDGATKMSKSRNNYIPMTGDPDEVRKLIKSAVTDITRAYRSDPGHPEQCNVCQLHRVFSPDDFESIWEGERTATTGCVDVKGLLADRVIEYFAPMRERRLEIDARDGYVEEVLAAGAARAATVARETLGRVKEAVGLHQHQ